MKICYHFDEQGMIDKITDVIKSAFSASSWTTAFGRKKMQFVNENSGEVAKFPVTYIEIISPSELSSTHSSAMSNEYTEFSFVIEQYNQAVGEVDKRTLGIRINNNTIGALQESFCPIITSNKQIASPDETIYRRVIEGRAIYNNKTGVFYRTF